MTDAVLGLGALQQWFLMATTHPVSVHDGLRGGMRLSAAPDLGAVIRAGSAETAQTRLEIYRRGYFARLTECLADDYSALRNALGAERFEAICHRYIVAHPSHEPNLNGFGRDLPMFVEQRAEELGAFAGELARLEWALVEVLHAPLPAALSVNDLAAIPPEQLGDVCFVASEALRLHSFEHSVNAYLQAFFEARAATLPTHEPCTVAIVRADYRIWRFTLSPAPATLLGRLVAGQPLGAALEGLDVTPDQIQLWFREWTTHGMFQRVASRTSG